MGGVELRAARLFNKDSGRAFITAFDHGSTVGPRAGSEAAVDVISRIISGNPDGILMAPGIMKQAGHLFGFRGAPAPIVRADWIFNHDSMQALPAPLQDREQGEHYRVICTPEQARNMGAEAAQMVAARQVSKKTPRTYGDYRQMRKNEELDSVHVATPDQWHALAMIAAVQAGEWLHAIAAGVVPHEHLLGEIGEVLLGDIAGRIHKDDITVYKSLGHTAQDLATADTILRMARASGQYPELPW